MISLNNVIGRSPAIHHPALPDLGRLRSSVNRVLARWAGVKLPSEQDREACVVELRDREAAGRWEGFSVSDLTTAARALYTPDLRDRPDFARLRKFFPAEIRASTRSSLLNGMASVYVDTYARGASHSRELGEALAEAQARLGDRWRRVLPWIPTLFDASRAHQDIAALMINMSDPWSELKRIGLQPLGTGLMDAAHLSFVAAIAPQLHERPQVERLFRWLKPDGQASARTAGAGAAIDALLRPWSDRMPDEDLRAYLMHTIRDFYGHPRLGPQAVWGEVGEPARSVMLRWLTGVSIRAFLDVVSESEPSHMWEPRRRFWLELYERKWIKDAWAAFCPAGELVARRRAVREAVPSGQWFGSQVAGGSRSDTSLLILELDRCVIVEGSHSYKVHVFKKDNPKTPRLHQSRYDCEAIRYLPHVEAISHHSGWEYRVREAIRNCA
ncbi:EH signature domain-containing protein [Amaricoccus solimangrovi]|uniref:Zorya protein ZorC EH domain-containing protein n=1 Tax=Amaricoccus solimangrovi TaxID=2589815 RepID=A0A501WE99_9RHOB|nr:EH signature domain-containing protein [Amaricoccus solimangrovi]TPE47162.1 hypothetical protein FJM51_20565 [Amaricoccus solimangrovi]